MTIGGVDVKVTRQWQTSVNRADVEANKMKKSKLDQEQEMMSHIEAQQEMQRLDQELDVIDAANAEDEDGTGDTDYTATLADSDDGDGGDRPLEPKLTMATIAFRPLEKFRQK